MVDVIILGAGVTGAFLARALSRYELNVIVIDQENDVGNFTSMANSALIHSGYDPEPGTLKAKLNARGNAMYDQVAADLDVIFRRIGSLTVTRKEEDLPLLKDLQKRGEANGVLTRIITAEELLKIEPQLAHDVKYALYAPTAGIIDPFELVIHCMENAIDNGVKLYLNERITGIRPIKDGYEVMTTKGVHMGRLLINATGVNADLVAEMLGPNKFSIKPRKGSYFVLDHFDNDFLKHIIFPMPDEHGKGIVATPSYSYNYLVGPNSNSSEDRDDLGTERETMEYIKTQALKLVPKIPFDKVIRTFSGLRATPSGGDFIIEPAPGHPTFINVAGIESPGLASAPAIAEYVLDQYVKNLISLKPKKNYNPRIRPLYRFDRMSEADINALIKKEPRFGHLVCRCEMVSEGHIIDALSRSCPPHSIKGVKKRTRAGFGRCQGGFCQPLVLKILADHYGVNENDILYDSQKTQILKDETKGGPHRE
jgi:glycerol-3-phosphate dehydrogenase